MALRNVTIDDRDTNTINFQGNWFQRYYALNNNNFDNTISVSFTPGDNFTINTPSILAFYYFGSPEQRVGLSYICIDCDPNSRAWVEINSADGSSNGFVSPHVTDREGGSIQQTLGRCGGA